MKITAPEDIKAIIKCVERGAREHKPEDGNCGTTLFKYDGTLVTDKKITQTPAYVGN
jgi:hypothetical protein